MEFTLKISDNWVEVLKMIGGFILFVAVTYYGGRFYLDRQRRDAEEGQRRIDEMNQARDEEPTYADQDQDRR